MARLSRRADEAGLREHLLEWEIKFRRTYGSNLPGAWEVLSKSVDRLIGGESYSFPRYLLPDDHAAKSGGAANDVMILTELGCFEAARWATADEIRRGQSFGSAIHHKY